MSTDCGNNLNVVEGADLAWYKSSDWAERGFCRKCGSSLFWRALQGGNVIASVQAFDDPASFRFASEFFIDEKPASYTFANDTHKMTGAEVFAAFAAEQDAANG